MLPTITIDGRVVADPELRFTPAGKAVCDIRIAANDSRKLDDGTYENTEQIFVKVTLWEKDAEAAADTFTKGNRILATGRLYQDEYTTRDGNKGTELKVKFPTVAKVPTAARGAQQPRQQQPAATPATHQAPAPQATPDNPWGDQTPLDEPPF